MSLSADVPPFVSGPVFHGGAPSQYSVPPGGGYLAAGPQVAPVPPLPTGNMQGAYPHYMVNCYPYISESIPQDGGQQGYPTQTATTPYTMPQTTGHPYPPNPYNGYQQQQQQPMYGQPIPPEQQGITTYQDPYYSAAYYPTVQPQQPSFQQQLPQGFQGAYTTMQSYQVPYSEQQSYHEPQQQVPPHGRHKNYSGNKHRSSRRSSEQSNVGYEAVTAELEAIRKRKTVVYVDADCQTDFPEHIANKTLSERPIGELVPQAKAVTKSTGNQTGNDDNGPDSSSDSCEEEEVKPQDSDSGYSGAGDVSGIKSYARVASQQYTPQPYQQQWPLPASMTSQGPVTTAPVSSYSRIVAGGHQPQINPQHQPPQQLAPRQVVPQQLQQQMAPHQPQIAPPHGHPMGVPSPQQYPGQYPSPHFQAQPGLIRLPQENKHSRQRRKGNEPVWIPPTNHPPPMISDANEYPELPVANRGMIPYSGQGYGGNPPQPPNFNGILQQKLNLTNEVDSDTSSEKDSQRNMMLANEFKGNKMFRKKVKKTTQDYGGPMVNQNTAQENIRKSGKRSQRPMELDLGLVLSQPQVPQQNFVQGRGIAYGSVPHFMAPPPAPGYQHPMGQQTVQWNAPGHDMRGPGHRVDRNDVGRKNIGSNPLDSSGVVMRGKQRETPAKKKPSAMKKVIIAERQEKKRMRDMQEKKLSDDEHALSQSTVDLDSNCYDSSFGLSQDPPSDRNSLSFNTHSDYSPVSQQDQLSLSPLSPGMGPSSQNGGISSSQTEVLAMKQIHSNKWREYCKQIVSKEIDTCCTTLLQTLVRFQERQYNRDGPIKAKAKRRIVMGMREVTKHLEKKKITCIIISTNLEKIQSKGGIDDALSKITSTAEDQGVPVVYALCRSALGRAVNKIVPVSVVGVFSYNGAEEVFKELIEHVDAARKEYQELLLEQKRVIEMKNVRNMKKLGHRRNISNCSGISFSSVISNPISENDPEPEPDEEELEDQSNDIAEDAGSVNREGSTTEKANSEASACTVEERQKRALMTQDQSCEHIMEEGGRDHEDDEEEEDDDSEKALAPEISVDERVTNWVAENQIQNLSIDDKP